MINKKSKRVHLTRNGQRNVEWELSGVEKRLKNDTQLFTEFQILM